MMLASKVSQIDVLSMKLRNAVEFRQNHITIRPIGKIPVKIGHISPICGQYAKSRRQQDCFGGQILPNTAISSDLAGSLHVAVASENGI